MGSNDFNFKDFGEDPEFQRRFGTRSSDGSVEYGRGNEDDQHKRQVSRYRFTVIVLSIALCMLGTLYYFKLSGNIKLSNSKIKTVKNEQETAKQIKTEQKITAKTQQNNIIKGNFHDGTTKYCESQWENDYRMQEYCLNKQYEAYQKFISWGTLNHVLNGSEKLWTLDIGRSDPEVKITIMCLNQWFLEQYKTFDFRMVVHCIDKQIESYNRLKN